MATSAAERPPERDGEDHAAELARRVAAGDRAAEAELVSRFGRGAALVLARHTRSAEEAEDLYQDTFRLAIEKLRAGELRDPSRLPAFLARVARNLAIEHYRKVGRRKTEAASDTLDRVAAEPASAFPSAPSGFPGALGELLDREKAALVRRVIGELPTDRDREVIYRFYIAEDDREAIAADLGLDALQLNRVLYRARERYRVLYQDHVGPESAGGSAVSMVLFLFATAILPRLVPLLGWRHSLR